MPRVFGRFQLDIPDEGIDSHCDLEYAVRTALLWALNGVEQNVDEMFEALQLELTVSNR